MLSRCPFIKRSYCTQKSPVSYYTDTNRKTELMLYGFLCNPEYFRPKCWNYGKLPLEADLRSFLYFLGGPNLYWKMGKNRKINPSHFYKTRILFHISPPLLIQSHYFQYKCNTPLFKLMGRWAGWYLVSQSITSVSEASMKIFGCHLMTVWDSSMKINDDEITLYSNYHCNLFICEKME